MLVTYDEFGNYGHPDHIQAHRVATYAATLAAVGMPPPRTWAHRGRIAKIYWTATSESEIRALDPGAARGRGH